jgi:hypothetical protein
MQALSQSLFILSFVLPPLAVVLGVAALAMPRRSAGLPTAAPPPREAALN